MENRSDKNGQFLEWMVQWIVQPLLIRSASSENTLYFFSYRIFKRQKGFKYPWKPVLKKIVVLFKCRLSSTAQQRLDESGYEANLQDTSTRTYLQTKFQLNPFGTLAVHFVTTTKTIT